MNNNGYAHHHNARREAVRRASEATARPFGSAPPASMHRPVHGGYPHAYPLRPVNSHSNPK